MFSLKRLCWWYVNLCLALSQTEQHYLSMNVGEKLYSEPLKTTVKLGFSDSSLPCRSNTNSVRFDRFSSAIRTASTRVTFSEHGRLSLHSNCSVPLPGTECTDRRSRSKIFTAWVVLSPTGTGPLLHLYQPWRPESAPT